MLIGSDDRRAHSTLAYLISLTKLLLNDCRTSYPLGPGDSLMFDGGVSHGPERLVTLPIRFLSITIELDEPEPGGD